MSTKALDKISIVFFLVNLSIFIIWVGTGINKRTTIYSSSMLRKLHDKKMNISDMLKALEERLTFERRPNCRLDNLNSCRKSNKSLVVTFWSESSKQKWVAQNILTAFPTHSFDHVVFVFDKSVWTTHPAYEHLIFIHVYQQIRLWFVKRFLSLSITRQYRYIWIIDDDAELLFDPRKYECISDILKVPLSAPGRVAGIISHGITASHGDYKDRIGRWTDFVEIGPIFIASSDAWSCIYQHLTAGIVWGWGLDMIWCRMLSEACAPLKNSTNVCAILDVFDVKHQSNSVNSAAIGASEMGFYGDLYKSWVSSRSNMGPLTTNTSLIYLCP